MTYDWGPTRMEWIINFTFICVLASHRMNGTLHISIWNQFNSPVGSHCDDTLTICAILFVSAQTYMWPLTMLMNIRQHSCSHRMSLKWVITNEMNQFATGRTDFSAISTIFNFRFTISHRWTRDDCIRKSFVSKQPIVTVRHCMVMYANMKFSHRHRPIISRSSLTRRVWSGIPFRCRINCHKIIFCPWPLTIAQWNNPHRLWSTFGCVVFARHASMESNTSITPYVFSHTHTLIRPHWQRLISLVLFYLSFAGKLGNRRRLISKNQFGIVRHEVFGQRFGHPVDSDTEN